ncbi:hypothetical protein ISF_01958 [Cordyceps fumosorosea ARSEF 2679]|uniref:Uncharacterized protein n=1 Tax=Cordyceps fumosorosea (strain ARSEF 2679) TaxID=1081104 RepID=A0A168CI85_CORFA|nr:hypothetical protein ISF_01958 [Cordyceps fumosorosea ARSEF 2679]OAA71407.1 hypothetical protein ISF_01958 [Cordyceps fumosorosea ARSEF 2679]
MTDSYSYWDENIGSAPQRRAVRDLISHPLGSDELPPHFDSSLYNDEFTRSVFALDRTKNEDDFNLCTSSADAFKMPLRETFGRCANKAGALGLPACRAARGVPCGAVYAVAIGMRQWSPSAIIAWVVQLGSAVSSPEDHHLAKSAGAARAAKGNLDVVEWMQTLTPSYSLGRSAASMMVWGEIMGGAYALWSGNLYYACVCVEYGKDAWAALDPFAITVEAIEHLPRRGIGRDVLSGMVTGDVAGCAVGAALDRRCVEDRIDPAGLLRLLSLNEALNYRAWTITGHGWGRTLDLLLAGGGELDCPGHVATWGHLAALSDICDRLKDRTDTHDNIVNAFPEVDWPAAIHDNFNKATDCGCLPLVYNTVLWWCVMAVSHAPYRPREEVLAVLRNFDGDLRNQGHAWRKATRLARFSGQALADIGCMQTWDCKPVLELANGIRLNWCSDCYMYDSPLGPCSCADQSDYLSPEAREASTAALRKLLQE